MRWIGERRRAVEAWLGPVPAGILEGTGVTAGLAAAFALSAVGLDLADPSQEVFRDLAQAEIGLFVAFSVATAGAGLRAGEKLEDHLNWLGVTCGIGISALLGIGLSIALAAYREAGHASALDIFGLCWILSSTFMLGFFVALLPYAVFVWKRPLDSSALDSDAE